jgi:class 3 adenylate cyclase/predicted ATPase
MFDVASWLAEQGLEQYAEAFAENAIDDEILRTLSGDDLKELGITALGHRKKLLAAIALLSEEPGITRAPEGRTSERSGVAERRQLTVLFCDLVGSTELSARLDPEDLREIIGRYQDACAEVIGRFEGHVARFLGDGALAYFGWPRAHEHAAEKAVRAGLALVEVIAQQEPGMQARVGVATGPVVVGDLIGRKSADVDSVIGETPNLAARLQTLAEPGTVVIGEATRRLVGGLFELDDLGSQRLKGFAEPLAVWRVTGESRSDGRFEAMHAAGLTPLVGRDHELSLLLRLWKLAKEGEGQVVLLSGEPGIGKSRLVRELRRRLGEDLHLRLTYQCSPHHTTSPLHPLIEQLERAAGFARDDPPAARLDKLETLLARGTGNTGRLDRAVPLISALLGFPTGERYWLSELTPQRQKELTLQALVDQLEGLAAVQPVLLVYEDVHWIDPTTQELLGLTVERIQRLPVLALITCRPEFSSPWSGQSHVSTVALTRLGQRQGAAIVDHVVGDKALPAEVAAQIVAKTDGVPLFVEELTKAVLESDLLLDSGDRYELAGPLQPLAIPSTLHDSLLARLDRLVPVREMAQIGATMGREFHHGLLAAVADRPEAQLRSALDQLVASELVFRRGTPPYATYSFKHALVQDAAYGTLLKSRRQHLHARIAQVLEERFSDIAEIQPELLAHHFTEAGLMEAAAAYWHKAAQRSVARSATAEAVAQLTSGLEVLRRLPGSEERDRRELELQITLGDALRSAKRYDAAMELAYRRARELCQQLGEISRLVQVVYGQYVIAFNRPNVPAAVNLADELQRVARKHVSPVTSVISAQAAGNTCFARGNMAGARTHLEHALSWPDRGQNRADLAFAQYPALSLSYLSFALFALGYPDQAKERCNEALAEAGRAPLLTLALILDNALSLALLRRDEVAVRRHVDALGSLATERGIPFYQSVAKLAQGWALARRGQTKEGIILLREGMSAVWAAGMKVQAPLQLSLLGEAYGYMKETCQGLLCMKEALARAEETGERWYDAELYRLKGDLLADEDPVSAQSCHRHAIAIALNQGAKMWELRAATSLARLWGKQSRRTMAYELLAPVYARFSEGFDTGDLMGAKKLLKELT